MTDQDGVEFARQVRDLTRDGWWISNAFWVPGKAVWQVNLGRDEGGGGWAQDASLATAVAGALAGAKTGGTRPWLVNKGRAEIEPRARTGIKSAEEMGL